MPDDQGGSRAEPSPTAQSPTAWSSLAPVPAAQPRFWFLTKRYGWGWGPPVTWEGWVVLVEFIVLVSLAAWRFPPERSLPLFFGSITTISAVVIGICFWKGEPPRWRWGD
jgi:hypothetical protein